ALAIETHQTADADLLKPLLQQRGIPVRGKVRSVHSRAWQSPPPLPRQALMVAAGNPPSRVILAQHQSAPLLQHLVVINKVSQNLHAELMLRLLGKLKGVYGSVYGGLDVEQ